MVLTAGAVRGALGFLTRLPISQRTTDWDEFRERPLAIIVTGYVVGVLLVPAVLLPLPATTVAVGFVLWVCVVTGINHLDGLADLGDALVVHGDAARRHSVMTDTTTGVGALLAVSLVVVGLALAAGELAAGPTRAVGIVIAAEVSAKLGMVTVIALGSAARDGLGAQLTKRARPRTLLVPGLASLPVVLATWPHPAAAVALVVGLVPAVVLLVWARGYLGGVSGDVIGAANEIGRVGALHAGVVAWMHF